MDVCKFRQSQSVRRWGYLSCKEKKTKKDAIWRGKNPLLMKKGGGKRREKRNLGHCHAMPIIFHLSSFILHTLSPIKHLSSLIKHMHARKYTHVTPHLAWHRPSLSHNS